MLPSQKMQRISGRSAQFSPLAIFFLTPQAVTEIGHGVANRSTPESAHCLAPPPWMRRTAEGDSQTE